MKSTRHLTTAILTRARAATALAALLLVACAASTLNVGSAYANWVEVSCQTPNGSPAPSEGWTSFTTGSPELGSTNNTGCSPGNPMIAILSTDAPAPSSAGEDLQYTPPAGSVLAGGSIDMNLYADGGGYDTSGTAILYTPAFQYDGSDIVIQCARSLTPCSNGTSDFSGVQAIPANRGGNLYVSATCGGSGSVCNEGGSHGAWALAQVAWADILLSNNSTPAASDIGGTLLAPDARGTQELTLNATDPGGPGVYVVMVQVDGRTLYSATPNNNGGQCVPVGNSDGALMWDYSQPCRVSESIDLPIETASVTDGQHTLKVTVEDASQNSSVVYDGAISTHNAPVNSLLPGIEASDPQTTVGTQLSATDGAWEAPAGAGAIGYSGQWLRCDTAGENCRPVSGASAAAYTLTSADAGSTLRYQVTAKNDAGSAVGVSPASAVVPSTQHNSAPPGPGGPLPAPGSSGTAGTGSTGSGGTAGLVANQTPGGPALGAANGAGASEAAYITIGVASTINSTFNKSGVTVRGRLLDPAGQPIGGATLEVLQQVAMAGAPMRKIGVVHTAGDGSFTAHIAKGPSRLIRLAYRAFANETTYAFTREIVQHVSTGVTLQVAPTQITPHGKIKLIGHVLGGYLGPLDPVVELQVRYLGGWRVIQTFRCTSNGKFETTYKFLGATGRFPFRVRVRASTGRPYTLGYSTAHAVRAG